MVHLLLALSRNLSIIRNYCDSKIIKTTCYFTKSSEGSQSDSTIGFPFHRTILPAEEENAQQNGMCCN